MRLNLPIVAYHHVSSEVDPLTANLFVATRPEVFRAHVKYMAQNFDIVDADDLLAERLPRKPLLLTFDDAYRSVLTEAAPILAEFSAPSLFCIISSALAGDTVPIDNLLSLAVQELGAERVMSILCQSMTKVISVGQMLSEIVAEMPKYEIATAKSQILAELGVDELAIRRMWNLFLNKDDFKLFAKLRINVGNHSMTHAHFRGLSLDELDYEIVQSRGQLQNLSGQSVRCLSIPFGDWRDLTDDAFTVARSSGHDAIFLVHARSNLFRRNDDTFYRISLRNEGIPRLKFAVHVLPVLRSFYHGLR
jgi:peptidoglycan/xylan/chitin deacetylase (PgdA/CDA1 family)